MNTAFCRSPVLKILSSLHSFPSSSLSSSSLHVCSAPAFSTIQTDENNPSLLLARVKGATEPALLEVTIGERFRQQLEKYHSKLFLTVLHPVEMRLTYEQMNRKVTELCRLLVDLGLEKGDRVGLWMPSRMEWLVAQLATSQLGLINVSINTAYRSEELAQALRMVQCKALIMTPDRKTHRTLHHSSSTSPSSSSFSPSSPASLHGSLSSHPPLHPDRGEYIGLLAAIAPEIKTHNLLVKRELQIDNLPDLKHVICALPYANYCQLPVGMRSYSESEGLSAAVVSDLTLEKLSKQVSCTDPVSIQFTSGTTGAPKGATLTHRGILNNALLVGNRLGASSEDVLNVCVPQYHCFGQVLGNLLALNYGAQLVYPDEHFDPQHTAVACVTEKCTALYGVPTMWLTVLDQPGFKLARTVTKGLVAGSLCPEVLLRRILDQHRISGLINVYGMTETSPVSFAGSPDDPFDKRLRTVGRVLEHTECQVVDAEGRVVPVGTRGEIWTRGYCVGLGYWGDEQKTAAVTAPGGWMKTGDEGMIDQDGYCAITGRIKDIIIRGGENIYPIVIENFLMRHPSVLEAAVFGVPDARYGEVVAAWVKLRADQPPVSAQQLQDFCRGQIAHYNIPKYILFRSDFPMTVSGKMKKHEMKAETIRVLSIPDINKS